MKQSNLISWALRILIAAIYLQTLYYKFTAHPDSVYIFTQLGVEPYGRIGLGIIELITSILILIPRTKIGGLLVSLAIIIGAIFSHLIVIGTNVKGDSGTLFLLAITVFAATVVLLIMNKKELQLFINKILRK